MLAWLFIGLINTNYYIIRHALCGKEGPCLREHVIMCVVRTIIRRCLTVVTGSPKTLTTSVAKGIKNLGRLRRATEFVDIMFFLINFNVIMAAIFPSLEIIETVISSGLRPNTSHHRSCEVDDATELMRRCWAEDPLERPVFAHLKGAIRRLNK